MRFPLRLAAFFLLLLPAAASAARKESLSLTYDQVLKTNKGTFTTKVWIKGDRKRTETQRPTGIEIDIIQGDTYIQILPDLGVARRMPLGANRSISPLTVFTATGTAKSAAADETPPRQIGTEVVADLNCKVFEMKSREGTRRVWVSDVLPFPVKWEEIDKKEGKFSYEVQNLQVYADIPDDFFEVPEDIKIIDADVNVR